MQPLVIFSDLSPKAVGTGAPASQSEDCLTLNVIRPDHIDKRHSLPVLGENHFSMSEKPISNTFQVWIYGGGFSAGTTSSPVYNLTYLAQKSVNMGKPTIVVSLNYRLALFGFLASSDILESGNANLGLKDQRLALRWIKENIHSFGGGKWSNK